MVEVDSGDGGGVGIVWGRCTVDSGVVADVGSTPVGGEVFGVGGDCMFPCLEGFVGFYEPWVDLMIKIRVILAMRWFNGDKYNDREDDNTNLG